MVHWHRQTQRRRHARSCEWLAGGRWPEGAVCSDGVQSAVYGPGYDVLDGRTLRWTEGVSVIRREEILLCLGLQYVLNRRQRGAVGEGVVCWDAETPAVRGDDFTGCSGRLLCSCFARRMTSALRPTRSSLRLTGLSRRCSLEPGEELCFGAGCGQIQRL